MRVLASNKHKKSGTRTHVASKKEKVNTPYAALLLTMCFSFFSFFFTELANWYSTLLQATASTFAAFALLARYSPYIHTTELTEHVCTNKEEHAIYDTHRRTMTTSHDQVPSTNQMLGTVHFQIRRAVIETY